MNIEGDAAEMVAVADGAATDGDVVGAVEDAAEDAVEDAVVDAAAGMAVDAIEGVAVDDSLRRSSD